MANTTNELMDLIRDDLDEANITDVSDADILQKLNRAQRKGVLRIISNFDSLFLDSEDITTVSGQSDYDWPDDTYAGKIKKLELIESTGIPRPIDRIWYRQSGKYARTGTTTRPSKYEIVGKKIRLYSAPAGDLTVRVHYVRNPENLVTQQGRILSSGTDAATSQPYVIVDAVPGSGWDITTSSTGLNNYVNVIDWKTGRVKGTLQVASVNTTTKQVLFKAASLTRSSVLGKTVSTSLPTDIEVDDYICTVHGTCVSEIPEAYHDYLTQHAVVAIKRSKGEPTQEDYAALKEEEEDIKNIDQGTEQRLRVTLKNPLFTRTRRR